MDKYEFNIKVEQIKKMVNKEDFATAMKIADTIDWRRVRNANLLSTISQVYEKNGEYQEAKEVLLLAFERAPIGKRFLYKLTELALKEGSLREAEDYYKEFCQLAPEDTRQYILRYLILKGKNASLDQLIQALERYINAELDEKWMYELAELYAKAGRNDACVQLCDKMILLFGVGTYVEKAGELKQRYAPPSSSLRQPVQMPGRGGYGGNVIQMPGTSAYSGNWQNPGQDQGAGPVGYGADNGYGPGYGPEDGYGTGAGYGTAGSYEADQSHGPESSYSQSPMAGSAGGYVPSDAYNPDNGYISQDSYGTESGYGVQNSYGAEGGYGAQNGYGAEGSYVSQNSYEAESGYGIQNNYGTEGSYVSQNSYGEEGSYGVQNSYGTEGGYEIQNSRGAEGGYGVRNGYGTENDYVSQDAYGSGTGSGYAPQNTYGAEGNYSSQNSYETKTYGSGNSYGAGSGYVPQTGYEAGPGYGPQSNYETEPEYGQTDGYGTGAGYGDETDFQAGAVYDRGNDYGAGQGYNPGNGYGTGPVYERGRNYGTGSGYGGAYEDRDRYESNPSYGSDEDYGMGAGNAYVPESGHGGREYLPSYNEAGNPYYTGSVYGDRDGYGEEGDYGDNGGYAQEPWQEPWQEPEEERFRQRPAGYGSREYGYVNAHGGYPQGPYVVDEEMMANLHQAAAEKELAAEMSKISTEEYMEPEPMSNQTRVFRGKNNVRILRPREEEDKPFYTRSYTPHHMIIEAKTAQEGFQMAVEELKKVHQETGVDNAVIKISGSKLSRRGIFNVSDKLSGKDLIVEEAGDLTQRDLEELQMLLERDETGMIVVLIDNPHQIIELHQQNPGFSNLFKCISREKQADKPAQPEETWPQEQEEPEPYDPQEQEPSEEEAEAVSKPIREPEPDPQPEEEPKGQSNQEPQAKAGDEPEQEPEEEVVPQPEEVSDIETETASALPKEDNSQETVDSQEQEETEEQPEDLSFGSEDLEDVHEPEEKPGDPDDYEEEQYLEDDYPEDYADEDYPEEDQYPDEDEYQDPGYDDQEYEAPEPIDEDEELGIEAFADYAVQYANDIDCSITGKSLLALYEKVDVMEENGIPLTRANAEDMIEEAADKAEKPSFGGLIKGVFSSKYDKEGLLILKEEHFM